ncbi:hypothetical protein Salat_2432500 [Sesamum alatum]|uniref:Uncharacterized protein n=1 Tax=Sesamum alatum TaxID=300844 RepID=A0AAE1XZ08_9LAMI|nr:hypothetical protein Salat_2432500 [Sesamum alatum]
MAARRSEALRTCGLSRSTAWAAMHALTESRTASYTTLDNTVSLPSFFTPQEKLHRRQVGSPQGRARFIRPTPTSPRGRATTCSQQEMEVVFPGYYLQETWKG